MIEELINKYFEQAKKDFDKKIVNKEIPLRLCNLCKEHIEEYQQLGHWDKARFWFIGATYCDLDERMFYLENAVKEHPEYYDYFIYEKFLDAYINGEGVEKDLIKALDIVNNCKHWSDRYKYKNYLDGLIHFENKEYEECLKINSYKLSKEHFLICYRNLGGNHYNISTLNDFYCSEDSIKDINQSIEEQKKLDKANYEKNITIDIPDLTTALKNEIPYFIEQVKRLLGIELSNNEIEKLNNIDLIFSYEKKQEKYAPTEEDIINLIKQLIKAIKDKKDDSVNDIIDDLRNIIAYIEKNRLNDVGQIKSILANIRISDNDRKLYNIYHKIINALEISTYVTYGEYNNNKKQITLYLSNIYNQAKELKLERIELMAVSVFTHELFHAYHYINLVQSSNNKEDDIVIESLASFFQSEYCMIGEYDDNISYNWSFSNRSSIPREKRDYFLIRKNIRDTWKEDMYIYPYSGANYMYLSHKYMTDYNFALFRKIYNQSLDSMHNAFKTIKFFYELEAGDF